MVIFDLETRLLAQELDPIEDVGWEKLRRGLGGISALCIYDYKANWPFVYDDNEVDAIAAHLEAADVVVGFRSQYFDIPIVEGLLKRKLNIQKQIDLYEAIKKALDTAGHRTRRGEYTLGAICERTLGQMKTEKGEHAPQLARDGEWGRLYRYCMSDVLLTKNLTDHILNEGGIITVNQTFLSVKLEV